MTGQNTSNDSISCNLSCMCAPKYIKIYKGYDTYFNGKHLIHIGFVGLYAETDKTYRFTLGGITKTYTGITDGFFVDLTKAETATLPLGPLNGSIIAIDSDGHETPMTTAIPFIIENWVSGDIVVEQNEINIDVIEGETPQFKITILSPYFETILHNDLRDRDAENCHPISAITGLQTALDSKQDVIQDLEQIRAGAALGATSVQTVGTGTANGTIAVDGNDVSVKGLGSAAFENTTAFDSAGSASAAETSAKNYAKSYADSLAPNYATAAQGALADTAVQTIQTGTNNGTISVDGTDVAVKGLGSAAYTPSSDYDASGSASTAETNAKNYADSLAPNYATSAQGSLADSALQPSDVVDNVVSTDTDKPLSANMGKSLQDQVDNLKARGRFLALWNCATGLAQTNPPTGTYEYKAGDYFIIGTVATGGAANYRPTGSSYTTGVPSTVVETAAVDTDDVYYYDGTNWALQINTQKTVGFENIAGSPYDNSNLSSALNDKQDVLTEGAGIDIDNTTNTISNSGVRSVSTGSTNGTLSINTGGTNTEVAVAGLGSAAYTQSSDYATSAQGTKADSAIQSIATGSANGTISVDGTDVPVKGLDSAAYTPSTDYATAAQGSKADTAVQPGDLATVATTGAYGDLSGQPTIPTVNNPTITLTQGGVTKGSFTLNQSSAETIELDAGGGGGASSLTDIANAGKGIKFSSYPVGSDYTVVGTGTTVDSNGIASGFTASSCIESSTIGQTSFTIAEVITMVNPTSFSGTMDIIGFSPQQGIPIGFPYSQGYLGIYTSYPWTVGSTLHTAGTNLWVRVVQTLGTSIKVYSLVDNGYNLDTLPDISSWTLEATKEGNYGTLFSGTVRFGKAYTTDEHFNGTIDLTKTAVYVNGSLVWRALNLDGKTTINADIATSVNSSSTNNQSVGAKLFYDTCGDIETLINAL